MGKTQYEILEQFQNAEEDERITAFSRLLRQSFAASEPRSADLFDDRED